MLKKLNILIVDDHPLLIDAYINLLNYTLEKHSLNFLKSTNAKEAYLIIKNHYSSNNKIDLAIFDISIPPYKEESIFDGCDLALKFKELFSQSKTLIFSMHHEGCLINKIIIDIKPNAIINKSDIDYESFSYVIEKVLKGETFISETMKIALENYYKTKFYLDEIDLEIIRLIDKEIKTKDLPLHFGISLSAIEKRKNKIKYFMLNGKKGNDKLLLKKAKELNLI